MRFDVAQAGVTDRHAILKRREFKDDSLLRFCILMISSDSPFADERDFELKCKYALEHLRLSTPERKRISLMAEKDAPLYREYIYELFRLLNDVDYEAWFSLKTSFHILSARLRSVSAMLDSDRQRAMKDFSDLARELKQLEYRLFKEDHMRDAIIDEATARSLGGYAEMFALDPPA